MPAGVTGINRWRIASMHAANGCHTMNDRIIVQQLHCHWTTEWKSEPQAAFGGATPAEAADRLGGVDDVNE